MDSIVQFIRNALCVTKDLHFFHDTFLWNATITNQYYNLPEPYNKTTPLEVFISITQIYVLYSGIPFGLHLLLSNHGKLTRIQRLMKTYDNNNNNGATIASDVDRIVNASLLQEANIAIQTMFVGFNVFFISCSFVWLAGNSWHVTETDVIGGVPGLIHALTVMNICLMPLLYYMHKDGWKHFAKARSMETIVIQLQRQQDASSKSSSSSQQQRLADIDLPTYEILSSFRKPFWNDEVGGVYFLSSYKKDTTASPMDEKKLMADEKQTIKETIETYCSINTSPTKKTNDTSIQEKINEIQAYVSIKRLEGYRELLYFLLNFIAWYGYGACVLVYYFADEMKQPRWMRYALLHFTNPDADYYGNLAGDCMWTIEPIIALLSPMYLNSWYRNNQKKVQASAKAKKE